MALQSITIFSASNLTVGSGTVQAIRPQDTDGVLAGGSGATYTHGSGSAIGITVNDRDTGAGGNRVTVFDDGTDVNQVLADPVKLSFSDGSRTVSRTFPAGTQIQAEFKVTFQSGFTMIGLRLQNPAAPPDLINAGYTFLDSNGVPAIPPVGSLGRVVSVNGDGSTPWTDIVCFAAGTLIDTPNGARRVEVLAAGDLVVTADGPPERVTWTGRLTALPTQRNGWPVVVPSGLLGNRSALFVSPQHRLRLQHPAAELLFGAPDVLVPALALVGFGGVTQHRPAAPVVYAHFSCDRHELVRANGAWCETLLAGEGMFGGDADAPPRHAVRPVLKLFEARVLADEVFGRSALRPALAAAG